MNNYFLLLFGTLLLLLPSCRNNFPECLNGGKITCNEIGSDCDCRCAEDFEGLSCEYRTGEVMAGNYIVNANAAYYNDGIMNYYFSGQANFTWSPADPHKINIRLILSSNGGFAQAGDTCFFTINSTNAYTFTIPNQNLVNTGYNITGGYVNRFPSSGYVDILLNLTAQGNSTLVLNGMYKI